MTGREEMEFKAAKQMERLIQNQPEYVAGFYYYMDFHEHTTREVYVRKIIKFLRETEKNIEDITMDDITQYISKLKKKNGENVSDSYRTGTYAALKDFFGYLMRSGRITQNPMAYTVSPKRKKIKDRGRSDVLNIEETQRYLNQVELGIGTSKARKHQHAWKERDMAIITLFLYTGMRCSALTEINIGDIDMKRSIISTVTKGGYVKEFELNNECMDYLFEWITKRKRLLGDDYACEALFISNKKKRISTQAVSNIVKKYAANISGKRITPHRLRATYGTYLYQQTGDIYFVSRCMGHASIDTTKIYISGIENPTQRAANIMSGLIGRKG